MWIACISPEKDEGQFVPKHILTLYLREVAV
jgi:hypothetical protein